MLKITVLAALVLLSLGRASLAVDSSSFLLTVADQRPVRAVPKTSRHDHIYQRPYRFDGGYPFACEAVIFPRTPLCAGRPAATFGPNVPWDLYWYFR